MAASIGHVTVDEFVRKQFWMGNCEAVAHELA
jgi:hypothetical protein